MVLKLDTNTCEPSNVFENDVKMYGTQTEAPDDNKRQMFENDVKMYGTQTEYYPDVFTDLFENDVKMYGTQTPAQRI